MPFIEKNFKTYENFASASINDIISKSINESTTLKAAYEFRNSIFVNDSGKFRHQALPNEMQIYPIYGISVVDVNKDGLKDLVTAGNYHNREVETVRSDAGIGTVALNQGASIFKPLSIEESGLYIADDVRAVESFKTNGQTVIGFFSNNTNASFYKL